MLCMMCTRVNDISPTFTFQAIVGSFFIVMKLKAKVKLCTSIPYITSYQQLPYLLQVPYFSKHNTSKIMSH